MPAAFQLSVVVGIVSAAVDKMSAIEELGDIPNPYVGGRKSAFDRDVDQALVGA